MKPKIITLCGSSKFTDIMAVCAWQLEKQENAIAMGLHLLPLWYPDCPPDHLAEHEGVADQMDALHLRKIDISDEIFVVDFGGYIGSSTANEIAHAVKTGKPVRYFTSDSIGADVGKMIKAFVEKEAKPEPIGEAQSAPAQAVAKPQIAASENQGAA